MTVTLTSCSPPDNHLGIADQPSLDPLAEWHSLLVPAIEKLRLLAGTSENAFLHIGEQMQSVYHNSSEISQVASQLVETASGKKLQVLSDRLRQMTSDMELFLASFQSQSTQSLSTLHDVNGFLGQLEGPLEGVQKMTKTFYMLEVSIKIESARLGKMGDGFVTLAMDINNLSQQVNDKLGAINTHRSSLLSMISKNLSAIQEIGSVEEQDAGRTLKSTRASLYELSSAHERFSQLGGMISDTIKGISNSIGEVVSSLQFHDINRQQLEHIIDALERLTSDIATVKGNGRDDAERKTLLVAAGDACELQNAQLHFAQSELYTAVSTIIESLRNVASLQSTIQHETMAASGVMDETGSSFVDAISRGMSITSTLLNTCASSHQDVSRTMEEMAAAICASTSFVNEIDGIGYSIVQTALNAQIKAGQAAQRGATLAALAGEIRRLSDDASSNTDVINATLNEINTMTTKLINDTTQDKTSLSAWLTSVDKEVAEVMALLGDMKKELCALVTLIQEKIQALAEEVERITASIDVHERSKLVVEEVATVLALVVAQSRDLFPASNEFKESLRQMNEHYTMESERQVHQAIASNHGVEQLELADLSQMPVSVVEQSEFGDNVDLF